MGKTSLVFGLLLACATPQKTARASSAGDDSDAQLESTYAPATVQFTCSAGRAYDVALRELVERGFDVSFSDAGARVIRAERTIRDNISTHRMERKRRKIWDGLDYSAQRLVLARWDEESRKLAHGGSVWTRTMYLAVTIDGYATIRPTVKTCEDFDGHVRCGTQLAELRPSEADLVREIGEALLAEEAPAAPTFPDAQQM